MAASINKMSPVPDLGQSVDTLDASTHGQLEVLASLESGEERSGGGQVAVAADS